MQLHPDFSPKTPPPRLREIKREGPNCGDMRAGMKCSSELNRFERKGPQPITVIIADLNALKTANDELGHAVGDALLRRAGEVFGSPVDKPAAVARIGGDKFAVLLPATDIAGGDAVLATLAGLIDLNNQYYRPKPEWTHLASMLAARREPARTHSSSPATPLHRPS